MARRKAKGKGAKVAQKGRWPQGHALKGKTSSGGPKFLNKRKGGATQSKTSR